MSLRDRRPPCLAACALHRPDHRRLRGEDGGGDDRRPTTRRRRRRPTTPATSATTELAAGTHRFEVTNKGSKVTEFYVYADGDKVMAEVENIAPGLSREVLAELPAGRTRRPASPAWSATGSAPR